MENISEYIKIWFTSYGINIAYALAIFIIGRYVAKFIAKVSVKAMDRASVNVTVSKFLKGLIYYILLAAVVIAALNRLGIETTSIVAVLATAGLAIGLALKDSLSNFAAGVMIIIFKPFLIGNYVEAGGTAGVIEEIGIFTVKMRTPDNKLIIVPNSSVIGGNIINYSVMPTRRVDITACVSYDADIKQTKEILQGIQKDNENILSDPAPEVVLMTLGDSSVDFVMRSWVKTENYWPTYFSMMEQVKMRLDSAGISIPFPQMDVHIKKED